MVQESLRLKALQEDRRFTEYRLQVASELPAGSYRDAVLAGIAARLETLGPAWDERAFASDIREPRASIWNGRH